MLIIIIVRKYQSTSLEKSDSGKNVYYQAPNKNDGSKETEGTKEIRHLILQQTV